ncbi:GNAT family N-acetyltransferase [Faecalimonas hominis]|jgi:diamine N-acetyltransferase
MISLERVNEQNYQHVFALELADNQKCFVSSNMKSLAQAWIYYDRARPYAIRNDNDIIGFIMFDYKPSEKKAEIWRFMIGKDFQGKGYGTEALSSAIRLLANENLFSTIQINYVKGNFPAKHLYEKLGFQETGEMEENEIVMKLYL